MEAVKLTGSLLSGMWPKFSPDGSKLVFLSHEAAARSGVHSATASLHTLSWDPVRTGFDYAGLRRSWDRIVVSTLLVDTKSKAIW